MRFIEDTIAVIAIVIAWMIDFTVKVISLIIQGIGIIILLPFVVVIKIIDTLKR